MAGVGLIDWGNSPSNSPTTSRGAGLIDWSTPADQVAKGQAVAIGKQAEQQALSQQLQPKAPQPKPQSAISRFFNPIEQGAKGIIKSTKQIASIPVNEAKSFVAAATGNKVARANASNQLKQGLSTAGQFAQAPFQAGQQIYQSAVQEGANIVGAKGVANQSKSFTPKPGFEQVFFGKQPIKSIQQTVKEAPGGTAGKIGTATTAVAGDALSLLGGRASIKSAKGILQDNSPAKLTPNSFTNPDTITPKPVVNVKTAFPTVSKIAGRLSNLKDTTSADGITPRKSPTTTDTSVKPAMNQSGAIAPGQAVSDFQAMIEKNRASTKFTGNITRDASALENNKKLVGYNAADTLNSSPNISEADKRLVQDYHDQIRQGLSPTRLPDKLQKESSDIVQINKETQAQDAARARLDGNEAKAQHIESQNPMGYVHREAMNKGSSLDYFIRGDRKSLINGGFGKSTGADKTPVMHAITDEKGNQRTVAIKNQTFKNQLGQTVSRGKQVISLSDGGKEVEPLGTLKLKTNQDLLDKELTPHQTKINNLQKEAEILMKVKTKGGPPDARLTALARKISLLEDGRDFSGLTKSEARSLRNATLKAKELARVKSPTTNATSRIATINRKLIDLQNVVKEIHDKYNPDTLENKVFTDKNGKKWTVGPASIKQIEKDTKVKYYVDPKATALKAYVDSRVALENSKYIDSIKKSPQFSEFARAPGETAPKGWKSVNMPQFMGYRFEPHIAEGLADISKNNMTEADMLDHASNFLKKTIVYFPAKHIFNEGATYATARGLSKFVIPTDLARMGKSLFSAVKDVNTRSPFMQELAKKGFSLPSLEQGVYEKAFLERVQNMDKGELNATAAALKISPVRLYNAFQHTTVWKLQDILNIALVREKMMPGVLKKGMSLDEAMSSAEKQSLQYKVPSRVAGSRTLSRGLQSRVIFFGRYKYDLYRILGNNIKDAINIKNPAEAARAYDRIAATVVGAMIIWPQIDKEIKRISSNPNAYMSPAGTLALPSEMVKVATGNETPTSAAVKQIPYVSGAVTTPLQVVSNTDSFTGKKIYDPNAPVSEQSKQLGSWLKSQFGPSQQISALSNAKSNKAASVLLGLSSAKFPKNSPTTTKINSLKFDSLPMVRSQAKAKIQAGDVKGAKDVIVNYNKEALAAFKADLKAKGQPIPSNSELISQMRKAKLFYSPSQKTINNWLATKKK